MRLGWRVTFIHRDHQHIVLVGIEDKDAARAAAIGDRTGVSRVAMEEIDRERLGWVEG